MGEKKTCLYWPWGMETFDFAAGDSSKLRFTFKLIVPCPEMATSKMLVLVRGTVNKHRRRRKQLKPFPVN